MYNILKISLPCLLLASCYTTRDSEAVVQKTVINTLSCKQDSIAHLANFFDGEKINFEYTPIALLTSVGNRQSTPEDVYSRLKMEAAQSCADAIISIKQHVAQGSYNTTDNFPNDKDYNPTKTHYYNRVSMEGMAVKVIRSDSSLPMRNDTHFVKFYNGLLATRHEPETDSSMQKGARLTWPSIVGLAAVIGIGTLFMLQK